VKTILTIALSVCATVAFLRWKNGADSKACAPVPASQDTSERTPPLARVEPSLTPVAQAAPVAPIARTEIDVPMRTSRMQQIGGGGSAASIPIVHLGSDEIRKFDLTLKQIVPGGSALANGCFYDVPPSESAQPERLPWQVRKWTQAGEIYLSGLPAGYVDGQKLNVWLVRAGTQTFTTALGTYRTLPAYRVAAEPIAPPAKPGAWMRLPGRTALDH
jgi:hypothetical protein